MSSDARRIAHASSRVYSRAAASYERLGPRLFTHLAQRLVELAAVGPGSRVLDVATGTGAILLAAAGRTGPDGVLVGVDITEEMLARAAQEGRDRGIANLDLRIRDAERLELDEAPFDYAFCGFALSSMPHPGRVLAGMCRALRPGGTIGLVEAPSWFFLHDPRWAAQADVFRRFGVEVGRYEPEREQASLVGLLTQAGLGNVVAVEESYSLDFRGEDEWWTWMWSHGSRSLLEAIREARLEDLRAALARELAHCRDTNGTIHGKLSAHLLVATKPTSSTS